MNVGTSYKRHGINDDYDTIVIGSGIGGLVSAALLATHADQKVLVLEKHYTAGGYTHTFRRKGFEWDVGVHYIGDVLHPKNELRKVFDDVSDGNLQWADMGEVYDTIVIDGDRYDLVKGRENLRAKLKSYFPEDGEAIDTYIKMVRDTVFAGRFFFMEKALPPLLGKFVGPLLRRKALKYSNQTVGEVLDSITKNRRLKAVLLGQFGDYGLAPREASFFIHAMVAKHYFEGGAYPVGGSAQMAATILPVIERKGGKVLTNAPVDQIIVKGNRAVGVRLGDGKEVFAKTVISDAGIRNTYGELLPEEVQKKHGFQKKLNDIPPSVAHISLYIGLDTTSESLGLTKNNRWIYPGEDHDASIENYLANPDEAPLPVAYLSFPSSKDPSFQTRYPGRGTVEVVGLAPFEWFAEWDGTRWKKRGEDYEALKAKLSKRLLEPLLKEYPQIENHIAHMELSTPLSTKTFCSFEHGEIYGLEHTPKRFQQDWLRPQTPIKGLYLTGADIVSCGVGGAVFGGVLQVSAMLKRNMLSPISKRAREHHRPFDPNTYPPVETIDTKAASAAV